MRDVFNDSALRMILEVLNGEQLAVKSILLDSDPEITVLVPERKLFRRYLEALRAADDGESLAELHLSEELTAWHGDDVGRFVVKLVEERPGEFRWTREPATQ